MPLDVGSTTVRAIAIATAASTCHPATAFPCPPEWLRADWLPLRPACPVTPAVPMGKGNGLDNLFVQKESCDRVTKIEISKMVDCEDGIEMSDNGGR